MGKKFAAILTALSVCALAACGGTASTEPTESVLDKISALEGEDAVEESTQDAETPEETESGESPEETEATEETEPTEETGETETQTPEETETEEEIPDISEITVTNEEDAKLLLKARFGTRDDETQFLYSFDYIDTVNAGGTDYYAFTWSWMVDNDHLSRLTEVFVQMDGSAIYEGEYDGETCEFYTGNMLEYE